MLVKLTVSQITEFAELIVDAVEKSKPPYTYSSYLKTNEVITSLLAGFMQSWIIYDNSDKPKILGLFVTAVMPDFYTKTSNLLIYSMHSYTPLSNKIWLDGFVQLKAFAREKGCFRIIAYSNLPNVIQLVKRLGGDASVTFLSMEVDE